MIMRTFPTLKTSAVAQYPLSCRTSFMTEILTFVDGTEQRYSNGGSPIRRWSIQLRRLDESELAEIRQFFRAQQGVTGRFSFTDPVTGVVYNNCGLDHTSLAGTLNDISTAATTLVIRAY